MNERYLLVIAVCLWYTRYWFSQPAWAFQVSGNYPRTAMRSFNTPTARCLMKLSPPPVQLRIFLHVFLSSLSWFIIGLSYLIPLLSAFNFSCGPQNITFDKLPFPLRWTCFFGLQPTRKALQTTGGWNAGGCLRLTSVACRRGGGSHGDDE